MARPSPASARNSAEAPLPLSQVIGQVKDWVERCGWIWVEGQIIELTRRNAPTQFLTLRDRHNENSARLTCSAAVLDAAGPLTEGATVVCCLTPRLWAKSSQFSFECAEIRIVGEGRLLAQLEQLKRKLQAEGLFDPWRKKPLPFLPRAIGLITGANSAAERDVINNILARWPSADIRVRHSLVQGNGAAANVMAALAELDAVDEVEVIIIARGGGSLEDLLPFSDEGLVRAVFAADTPVVSAIGHEPDVPILDLVADLRASTPTDAAKKVVPDAHAESDALDHARRRLAQAIDNRLADQQRWLDQLISRPALKNPMAAFAVHAEHLNTTRLRLSHAVTVQLNDEGHSLTNALDTIRRLSPKATLERGYAIVTDAEQRTVSSVAQVEPGDQLQITMSDGSLLVEVDYQEDE